MKANSIFPLLIVAILPNFLFAQEDTDALFIKEIYEYSLTDSKVHGYLKHLCKEVGPRLSGSAGAAEAVKYTQNTLQQMGSDTVFLVDCMVPHWEQGKGSEVSAILQNEKKMLRSTPLGNSIGTEGIIEAEVIEVNHLDSLEKLGEEKLKGKIVFFNRPMDNALINTGHAYGRAVDQRVYGATKSAQYGARAAIVRSMTTKIDDLPHTGVTIYEGMNKIPAIAISTLDAEWLSEALLTEPTLKLTVKSDARNYNEKPSHSVVAEIRGSEFPDEIILVGGHLDSWDLGEGAHDDGTGCVHSMQVFETLMALDYKPKRTLRCVMFMNEENGLAGGLSYAEYSNEREEHHIAAIESDGGGFTPRGFTCTADEEVFIDQYKKLNALFEPLTSYDLYLKKGGGGADINPLKSQQGLLIGFRVDNQRYFDLHHTAADVFENVNQRELELGAAAMTSLVYLIDKYGL